MSKYRIGIGVRLSSRVSMVTRNIDIANLFVRPSDCLSVRTSITFRYSVKTA